MTEPVSLQELGARLRQAWDEWRAAYSEESAVPQDYVLSDAILALLDRLDDPTLNVQSFWDAQAEWSRATFGSDSERDHFGPLKHLAKEAVEAQVRPADRTEIADCQFLVFDAARRAGMTLDDLFDECDKKLVINKARKWNKPTDDNPVEHVRVDAQPEDGDGSRWNAARELLTAMETCHICKCLVSVEEGPIHCEDCSSDCEDHEEPECTPINVLHVKLKRSIPAPPSADAKETHE